MYKLIRGFLVIAVLAVIVGLLLSFAKAVSQKDNVENPDESKRTSYELSIDDRDYLIGISGFFPANFPNVISTDIREFFDLVDSNAEVFGIHTLISEMKIVDTSAAEQNNIIELVVGIENNTQWPADPTEIVATLDGYISKYPQIKYVAIGNEINYIFDVGTADYNKFLVSYREIYTRLKAKFPDLKVFTTFQYETLIGQGYLTGRSGQNELRMLLDLEPYIDLVGLTSYPAFDHVTPATIPLNYFEPLRTYSSKPLAITETAWYSRTAFGNQLDSTDYLGSEAEQVAYLKRLVEVLEDENIEFVNWFSLHDIADWEKVEPNQNQILFDSMGLRKNKGEPKLVWSVWRELFTVPQK